MKYYVSFKQTMTVVVEAHSAEQAAEWAYNRTIADIVSETKNLDDLVQYDEIVEEAAELMSADFDIR